ncbi:MAG: hypothetical protein ABIJ09_26035 [Pseudomonadota bacterium]
MPHRISVAGLPRVGRVEELIPRCARAPGVRVHGVSLDGDSLLFSAEGGGLKPGLYRESVSGDAAAQLLRADDTWRVLNPRAVGEHIVVQLQRRQALSSGVEAIAVLDAGGECLRLPGQVLGVGSRGRWVLVMDLGARQLQRIDLQGMTVQHVAELEGALDPLRAVEPALSDDGNTLVFMDVRQERGDASLHWRDLASGASRRLLGPLPAPSWIAASMMPDDSVVAWSCVLGEDPRGQLWQVVPGGARRELMSLPVSQPCCAPVAVSDACLAMLVSLEAFPASTQGPVDLALLPLSGGTVQQVTHLGTLQGALRFDQGHVLVEGGGRVWRMAVSI